MRLIITFSLLKRVKTIRLGRFGFQKYNTLFFSESSRRRFNVSVKMSKVFNSGLRSDILVLQRGAVVYFTCCCFTYNFIMQSAILKVEIPTN